jgi:hypothetical protein
MVDRTTSTVADPQVSDHHPIVGEIGPVANDPTPSLGSATTTNVTAVLHGYAERSGRIAARSSRRRELDER